MGIVRHTLDFLDSNKKQVETALKSDILSKQIVLDITQKLNDGAQKGVSLPALPDFMARFITGALPHIFLWWLTQKRGFQKRS